MEKPIHYAVHEGVHIAYQVVGDGPIDLVYTPGIWSNLEIMWEWPAWARYLNRLASLPRPTRSAPERSSCTRPLRAPYARLTGPTAGARKNNCCSLSGSPVRWAL